MKKSYLILAAVAGLFASCSQEVLVDENVNNFPESPIGFSTFTESHTRADNSTAAHPWNLEDHHDNFNVWAWKYYGGAWESTAVYSQGTVAHDGTAWVATPIKFWDKSAEKYYFYAAAPADAKWTMNNGGGDQGYLTYTGFSLTGTNLANGTSTYHQSFKTVGDVDLMIAEDNQVLRAAYNKPTPDVVDEIFDHVLSRLNVTVKRGATLKANGATVKLTSFAITGVDLNNAGNFSENGAVATAPYTGGALPTGTTARWTGLSGTYNLNGYDISSTALDDTELYIAEYLIIPQSVEREVLDRANGLVDSDADEVGDQAAAYTYFRIAYTINDEPYVAYYNLAHAFNKAAGATLDFYEGWENTLHITLDADVITFDATVSEWAVNENETIIVQD